MGLHKEGLEFLLSHLKINEIIPKLIIFMYEITKTQVPLGVRPSNIIHQNFKYTFYYTVFDLLEYYLFVIRKFVLSARVIKLYFFNKPKNFVIRIQNLRLKYTLELKV